MSVQRDQGCLSLISAAHELAHFVDVRLPASFTGRVFELYPDSERFDDILNFISIALGGFFIPVGGSASKNKADNCLVYQNGRWTIGTDGLDEQKGQFFKFVPSEETQKLTLSGMIRLWIKRRTGFFSYFLIAFIINVLALGTPLYMNAIYGRVIPASAEASLWTLSVMLMAFFLIEVYLKKKKESIVFKLVSDFSVFFEPNYIRQMISIVSNERNKWGGARAMGLANLVKLKGALWILISSQYIDIAFCLMYFLVIAIIAQYLVVGVIVMAIIQVFAVVFFDYKAKLDFDNLQQRSSGLPIPFLDDYKANGMDNSFISIYLNGTEQNNKLEERKLSHRVSMNSTLSFISSSQTVVIVVFAYYLLQYGELAPGALFATIILSGKISQQISSLSSFLPLIRSMKETFQQINDVFSEGSSASPMSIGDQQDKDGWGVKNIEFSFEEKSGRKVLDNISFDIRLGEKVAIVGAGGSGKTILSRLLLGLIEPTRGRISFNSKNHPRVSALREDTYYFPQRSFLYSDTLFEYFGCNDEEKLKKVLSLPFMRWLPQTFAGGMYARLDTASGVSVDKMQMLEMCRFSVSEKNFWLLDEPTAFVGASVEKQFCSIMSERLQPSTTLLLFTGRSNMLHLVDRVIFIEDGRIAFDGSREKFLSMLT
ncbi:ATP-binding cassette domain-containing protein [Brucella anthropi]|uniref:ATP-binding cassette domain-containing protein n=2 Tax=Brucella/Ochrobactrum group TaxID=2826938 RepID=UPI0023617DA2|nr:ATP-binding cassette domain-containing protein [Brucella anthropi]